MDNYLSDSDCEVAGLRRRPVAPSSSDPHTTTTTDANEDDEESVGLVKKDAVAIDSDDDAGCYLPRRRIIGLLIVWGAMSAYVIRTVTSIAIIPMSKQYEYSNTDKGRILGAFYNGYLWLGWPGGWLATVWSAKWLCTITLFGCCVSISASAYFAANIDLLIVCQTMVGFCQGPYFPAITHVIASWCPVDETMMLMTAKGFGAALGSILAVTGTAAILEQGYHWSVAFYAFGCFGLCWVFSWMLIARDKPRDFPCGIRASEIVKISLNRPHAEGAPIVIPWGAIFSSLAVYTNSVMSLAAGFVFYSFVSWMPTYLESLGMPLSQVATVMVFTTTVGMACSVLAAGLSDLFVSQGVPVDRVRKVMQTFGLLAGALFMAIGQIDMWLEDAPSHPHPPPSDNPIPITPQIAALMAAFTCCNMMYYGYGTNAIDIGPRFTGFLHGFFNSVNVIGGIVGVPLVGWMIDNGYVWYTVFILWGAVIFVASLLWLFFARADVVFP
eukprot:gnl/Spiro4/29711_TR14587_c0_g1_i3.p1 gnl/Spiro4/29711_TR14587_c0_g1~~gnl/Spiro4/29711_TR14587_c0_g1_i3.p1  ORF type:complete len:497 (+),score=93.88 gnl/Spiro4/29711_TR14587_c0_g1_i3:137-1627(+)